MNKSLFSPVMIRFTQIKGDKIRGFVVCPRMELCTAQAISNVVTVGHTQRLLIPNPSQLSYKPSFLPTRTAISSSSRGLQYRLTYLSNSILRATTSEESSNQYAGEQRDGVVTLEDASPAERKVYDTVTAEVLQEESIENGQAQTFEFLDNLSIESKDTYTYLLYGGGALFVLWLASAVVGAIDSIPLFPKVMEVVGLGYTIWFTSRYLLFKKSREEFAAKVEELKQEILGSSDN